MQLAEFDYELPPELVATEPAARRDAARLLTLQRRTGVLGEKLGMAGFLEQSLLGVLAMQVEKPARNL